MAVNLIKTNPVVLIILFVAAVSIGAGIYLYDSKKAAHTDTATQKHLTPSQSTKNYAAAPSAPEAGKGSAAGGQLLAPSGQLLNKHTVSLGSTDPTTNSDLESVCQTVPNASCNIRLTMGSDVKYVGAKNTGSGSVIFDWNAKTVGLSPGGWTVQAVASQNGSTGVSHSESLQVNP